MSFGGKSSPKAPPPPPKPIDVEAEVQTEASAMRRRRGFLSTVMNRSRQTAQAGQLPRPTVG